MKRKQGLKWEKKERISYIPLSEKRAFPAATGGALAFLLSYAVLVLLAIGFLQIYGDVFSIEKEAYAHCVKAIFAFDAFLAAGYEFFPQKKIKIWNGLVLTIFIVAIIMRFKQITGAGAEILNDIFHFINAYYTADISDIQIWDGTFTEAEPAYLFFGGLLLWQTAYALLERKNRFAALLPAVLLFLGELLVGFAAGRTGILCCLLGVCGAQAVAGRKRMKKDGGLQMENFAAAGIAMGTFLAVFLIVQAYGADVADTLAEQQSEVLAYQRYMEQAAANWDLFSAWNREDGKVNNHTPLYLDKEVLQIAVSNKVKENVYLRGYVGDTYQGGNWKNKSKTLFAEEEWADGAQAAGYEILDRLYEAEKQENEKAAYTISYTAAGSRYAYLPYYADSESIKEELDIQADSMLLRKGQSQIQVKGLSNVSAFAALQAGKDNETQTEEAYVAYLELYLQVPDELEQLQELGAELKQELADFGAASGSLPEAYAAVCLVRNAVNERTVYSKELEEVPAGEDVAEYFLFESGEGYCTHYATAGTLLLRELGIPARYVAGYVVEADDFSTAKNASGCSASVLDSDSHAWTEIYVSGTGWIPVEMIEGFDSSLDSLRIVEGTDGRKAICFQNDTGGWQVYAADGTAENAGLEEFLYSVTGESLPEAAQTAAQNTEDTQEQETYAAAQEKAGTGAGNGESTEEAAGQADTEHGTEKTAVSSAKADGKNGGIKEENVITKVAAIMLAGAAVLLLGAYAALAIRRRRQKIRRTFYQKDYRKAVQSILAQMYRKLKKKQAFSRRKPADADFIRALRAQAGLFTGEEIDRLQEIMERAAFSREIVTKEDAAYCRKLYQRLCAN